jgi:cation:H+ antiporter
MLLDIFLLVFGLAGLVIGGNWLVGGASNLARWLRIPEMIIGLTIVSIGTSAPELVVNIQSALSGNVDLALANVVGSNIANILLILSIGALITPLVISKDTRVKDVPYMLLASLIIWLFVSDVGIDGATTAVLSRTEGIALIGFFIIFLVYMYQSATSSGGEAKQVQSVSRKELIKSFAIVPVGVFFLAVGGDMVVRGASSFALTLGVSERIIGLTIVAVGTSLPELVTTVISALKGKIDILIGNIVGSNIFNIFFILGITSVIKPLTLASVPHIDFIFMLGAVLIMVGSLYIGKKHTIEKNQAIFMIAVYVAYIVIVGFL